MKLFRDSSRSCKFCILPAKSDLAYASYILYPVQQDNDTYCLLYEYFLVSTAFKEIDSLNKSSTHRVGQYYPNQNRINNSTLLGHTTCVYRKYRDILSNRKHTLAKFVY